MLLFLAHVSPSFLRELPPVEISKDHPSEKSKVWLEPESATTTSVWQAEDWELCGRQRDCSGTPCSEAGAPGELGVDQLQAGHPMPLVEGHSCLSLVGCDFGAEANIRETVSY